jgi:hypothetical protein
VAEMEKKIKNSEFYQIFFIRATQSVSGILYIPILIMTALTLAHIVELQTPPVRFEYLLVDHGILDKYIEGRRSGDRIIIHNEIADRIIFFIPCNNDEEQRLKRLIGKYVTVYYREKLSTFLIKEKQAETIYSNGKPVTHEYGENEYQAQLDILEGYKTSIFICVPSIALLLLCLYLVNKVD